MKQTIRLNEADLHRIVKKYSYKTIGIEQRKLGAKIC